MGQVKLEITTNDADVQRKLDNLQSSLDKVEQKSKTMAKNTGDAAKVAAPGFTSLIGGANGAALAIGGVTAAVTTLRKEYDTLIQSQREAAGTQLAAADAEAAYLRNLGNVSKGERAKLLDQIRQASLDTGVKLSTMYQAANDAQSAAGDNDNYAVVRAVKMAARLAPDSPQEMSATAAGLLDLASITGSADAGRNAGFMLTMGAQTRVNNLGMINSNLVPAAIGVRGFGGSAEEAASVVTALTLGMKDATGATSGTAAVNLAKSMEKLFPDIGNSPLENIRAIQNDPKLREKFLKEAGIEAKAYIPVRDMLTAGTSTAKILEDNIGQYPSASGATAFAEKFIEESNDTPLQRVARLQRRAEVTKEHLELNRIEDGTSSIMRDAALAAAAAARPGWLRGQARRFIFGMPGRSVAEAADNTVSSELVNEAGRMGSSDPHEAESGRRAFDVLSRMVEEQKQTNQHLRDLRNQRTPSNHTEGR